MKILKVVALAIGARWLHGKYSERKNAYRSVRAVTVGIENVSIGASRVTFDMDLQLTNPSEMEIRINGGGPVRLEAVDILSDGQYLGTLTMPDTPITLAPGTSQTITGIAASVPTANVARVATALSKREALTTRLKFNVAGQQIKL